MAKSASVANRHDKLSYNNLVHQIESGLRKGHGESDVIEAVIRAISPGLKLRDMLEIKHDLTLPQLKRILKGHYKEDDASDLVQKLISISQDPKESAQDFLFRTIELKDRLLVSLAVAEIKWIMFSSMSAEKPTNSKQTTADNRDPRRRRGCRTCQDKGEGNHCSHCFKCGELGHISRGCRVPRQAQGYDQALLLRDRQ